MIETMKQHLALLLLILSTQTAVAQFAGGSGYPDDPYLIATAEQLNDIRNYQDKYFKLISDINLDVAPWNQGEGWEPIGSNWDSPFQGTINGNNSRITGLFINRPDEDYVGLFGYILNTSITNLGLENINVTGNNCVGGLSGSAVIYEAQQVIYSGIYIKGSVEGNKWVAGLFGSYDCLYSNSSVITNCYNHASVSGNRAIGGLIGYYHYWDGSGANNKLMVMHSYSTGLVTGNSDVGGLVGGYAYQNEWLFCYWDKDSSSQETSAGNGIGKTTSEMKSFQTYLLDFWDLKGYGKTGFWNIGNGRNDGYPYFSWEYPNDPAYNPTENLAPVVKTITGEVTAELSITISGYIHYEGNPHGIYGFCWNATGNPTIDDHKKELGEIVDRGEFETEIIGVKDAIFIRAYAKNDTGISYGEVLYFEIPPIDPIQPEGEGTEQSPFLVGNLNNLVWMQIHNDEYSRSHYLQTADIDATPTAQWFQGKGWVPIGIIRGSYNGNHYTINGLTINRPDQDYIGFFRLIGDPVYGYGKIIVSNLGLTNVNLTGKNMVGAFAYIAPGGIVNCYSTGIISGNREVGGLIGAAYNQIFDSYSNASVNGIDMVGGLVGRGDVNLINCFSTGIIKGQTRVGGLIGHLRGSGISFSYSTGNVQGEEFVGGFVGYFEGRISQSYSTANVEGIENVGVLVGYNIGVVDDNCYWNLETSGIAHSDEGMGLTTNQMLIPENFEGWDFSNDWSIILGYSYPYPKSQGGAYEWNYPVFAGQYPLSLLSRPANAGVFKGAGYYPPNVEIPVSTFPRIGYIFMNWEDQSGNVILEDSPSLIFTMPEHPATLYAQFARLDLDMEFNGEKNVCKNSTIFYSLSRNVKENHRWIVEGGTIINLTDNSIEIQWTKEGSIVLMEYENNEWAKTGMLTIQVHGTIEFTPQIHRKGDRNILICTTPGLNYTWLKDDQIIENENGQYYIADNNYGVYRVLVYDDKDCPTISASFMIDSMEEKEMEIVVFPNPATTEFRLNVNSEKEGKGTVVIYDITGRIVKSEIFRVQVGINEFHIHSLSLPKGLYLVNVYLNNEPPVISRITIN